MDLTSRIKQVIEYSGLTTRAFALRCGMNQPTLDRMMKGINALNLSCVCAVLKTFPEISAEWLMRGEGEMKTEDVEKAETQRVAMLVDTIATLQETINEKSRTIALLAARLKQTENQ